MSRHLSFSFLCRPAVSECDWANLHVSTPRYLSASAALFSAGHDWNRPFQRSFFGVVCLHGWLPLGRTSAAVFFTHAYTQRFASLWTNLATRWMWRGDMVVLVAEVVSGPLGTDLDCDPLWTRKRVVCFMSVIYYWRFGGRWTEQGECGGSIRCLMGLLSYCDNYTGWLRIIVGCVCCY